MHEEMAAVQLEKSFGKRSVYNITLQPTAPVHAHVLAARVYLFTTPVHAEISWENL